MPSFRSMGQAGCLTLSLLGGTTQANWDTEFRGGLEAQVRLFTRDAPSPQDANVHSSYSLQPELKATSTSQDSVFASKLFYRKDFIDSRRTHWDVREFKLERRWEGTAVTVGVDSVFWGKTESQNLVDVVNQRDGVEGVFTDEKLGQPMLRLRHVASGGVFEGYYLPYSRKATYAGRHGRLRTQPGIDGERAQYRTGAEQWYPGMALRWEPSLEDVEMGLSAFHGLSRDPSFTPILKDGEPWFAPVYGAVTQLGVDAQYVTDETLYKLEGIYRWNQLDLVLDKRNYAAVTVGIEHTIGAFLEGSGDLGLILEYNRDGIGKRSVNVLEDDVVIGLRYTLNDFADTYLLATVAVDRIYGSKLFKAELTRRLGESLRLRLEAFAPSLRDDEEFIYGYRRDASISTSLTYYW
ncbi:hypothetical protein [Pseudomonas sp. D(2018)]|uniref:hypothetical protein n=1 Tax=Pseudomonas sp. D(2018) TaxID=2502238 RepID=UPI0010F5CD40|nr:hypothetical protein [Pseudomonas sp. D(2018)]